MKTILTHNGYSATILHKGAELSSFRDPDHEEFIWQAGPIWPKHAPVLFPIVGSLKNDTYTYKGRDYQLSRHGFAREMDFRLKHSSESQAVFSLESSAATFRYFPFEFEFQINYSLRDNKLLTGYSVINRTAGKMHFSLGAHPAFALQAGIDRYSLGFEQAHRLQVSLLEDGLLAREQKVIELDNGKMRLTRQLFAQDALILKNIASKEVVLYHDESPRVRVNFDAFPHLGIWSKPDADFVCIEPWFGYSDAVDSAGKISEKESMLTLDQDGVFNTNFTIEVF